MDPNSISVKLNSKYKEFANFLNEEKRFTDQERLWMFGNITPNDDKKKLEEEKIGDESPRILLEEPSPTKEKVCTILLYTNAKDEVILHWGVGVLSDVEWKPPGKNIWPENTIEVPGAARTKFVADSEFPELKSIRMKMAAAEIKGINFTVNDTSKNIWYKETENDNYKIKIPQVNRQKTKTEKDQLPEFVERAIEAEATFDTWSLIQRYRACMGILESIPIHDINSVAWVFIWLRYSAIRQLDWQRKFNTPPKDLSHSQSWLGKIISEKWMYLRDMGFKDNSMADKYPRSQDILRQMLPFIGKGASNGQEIRDQILRIFVENGISEKGNHFYEQWHQKLHNNTTPDDIVICEALLAYLKSNDISQYWKRIYECGLSKERLASFDRPITAEPYYAPNCIGPFEGFLGILKRVHASIDLKMLAEQLNNRMNPDLNWKMWEVINNCDNWDTLQQMERVIAFRSGLGGLINSTIDGEYTRDLLYLDLAMEFYQRQLVEKILHIDIGKDGLIKEMYILLEGLQLSYKWNELDIAADELKARGGEAGSCDRDYYVALKMKASIDRLKRCLGEMIERSLEVFQNKATIFGIGCKCNPHCVEIFTEEVIRGSLFFALSMIIRKLEPIIRNTLGSQLWLIISPMQKVIGQVIYTKALKEYIENPKEPTILITEQIGGEEEIPEGVVGVLLIKNSNYPDVLAHVSVRARNNKVLLAVCFELEGPNTGNIMSLIGKYASVEMKGNNLDIYQVEKINAPIKEDKVMPKIFIPVNEFDKYYIEAKDFSPERVGAKSNNLNKIREKVEEWVNLPKSAALQFGVIEDILTVEENKSVKEELDKLTKEIVDSKELNKINPLLNACKKLILKLNFPDNKKGEQLVNDLESFGIPKEDIKTKVWQAIKNVYASKYNERAFIATKKIGVSLQDIRMAVLIQNIIPSDYSFVIHTKNPMNNSKDEMYIEVVKGLGETLVGSYAGQAFSFIVEKKNSNIKILTLLNKSIAIFGKTGYMMRSDSNTEDLEGFAGAGLFDSFSSEKTEQVPMNYKSDKLINDHGFRDYFMKQIAKIGISIETIYEGTAQDIEGCYYNDKFYVVQTRSQV